MRSEWSDFCSYGGVVRSHPDNDVICGSSRHSTVQSGAHPFSGPSRWSSRILIDEWPTKIAWNLRWNSRSVLLRRRQNFEVSQSPRFDPRGLPPACVPARHLVRDCGCELFAGSTATPRWS